MAVTLFQEMDLSKYTVLAVDDIPLNILLMQKMLSKFNFKLITAANGRQALEQVDKAKPDLILLDLMMPDIDGFEVIKRVRENPLTKDIKIIILSALNSNDDVSRGFSLGADDYITKPIIMEKLQNCVLTQFRLIESERS